MMASPSPPPCGPSPAAAAAGSPPPDPVHPPCTPSPSKRMRFLPHIDPIATDIETEAEAASSSSTCFHCKKQGHWVRDCPFKFNLNTPTASAAPQLYPNTAITPPSLPNVCHLPEIECNNGHGPCTAKVSRSLKNPGRIYYACLRLLPNGCQCRFFKWYDELKTNKNGSGGASGRPLSLSLSRSEYPMCSCGAGLCRLMLETSEPNAGGLYFVCPITKGHGACPFFLRYDGQANTGLTSCLDESEHDGSLKPSLNCHEVVETVNYDLDENDELSFEHPNRMTFVSAKIDNPQPDSTFSFVQFGPSEIEEEPLLRREERDDTSNMKTSANFSNLQVVVREHLHVMQEEGLLDPIMGKASHVSQKTSMQAEIHHQQIEFWRQSSVAGDTLTGGWGKDGTHQILDFQIFGWLGRLAFTPSGCLTVPPSKPKFCCVFPSLDPIFVPKETYGSHSEGLVDLPHSPSHSNFNLSPQMSSEDDARPLSGVLFELSGIKNLLDPLQDSVVTGKIVVALEQAALPIQNLLLTLLESMDPLQHESMTLVAECTFAALDHLSVDYRRFSERVRKFIACASSLAEVERSIRNDLSSKELIKGYHNEVDRFDNISRTHGDIVGAFTTSDHHLQSLRKEASRVKEMLLQIENQLSLCEVETSELKTRVDETAKDMIETEKRLQSVAQKAEAAMELCHQREVTRNAFKAAFEEARVKLR